MSYLEKEIDSEEKLLKEIEQNTNIKKIVLIGLTQTGKTSIVKTVFEGRQPEDTKSFVATVRLERKKNSFRDQEILTVDVGGQISYFNEAIELMNEQIFSNVYVLVFVVDITDIGNFILARQYLLKSLRNVYQFSKNPKVYLFAHKMDLISEEHKEEALDMVRQYFDIDELKSVEIFPTSIYDETTIQAFEKILG